MQEAQDRLAQAEGFLWWAQTALDETGDAVNADVAASLAVLAGIAATDAMCGKTLGHYSRSQSHADAAALLATVGTNGTVLVGRFRRLVAAKTRPSTPQRP